MEFRSDRLTIFPLARTVLKSLVRLASEIFPEAWKSDLPDTFRWPD